MSRARELAKAGGVQQRIAGFSSHVGMSTFLAAVHMENNLTVDGNANVGGNLTVTGTTTFNGGTLTLGDANTDNIVFGGEVDSHIIPDDDGTFDLGSSTKEWKDLYIDGTAHVDTLDVDENAGIIGNLTLTGNGDFNGDLDVDGTTNLDVVDIDGAVDMASNLVIAGNIDANGNLDVDGTTDLDATNVVGTLTVTGDIAADNVTINGNTVSTSSGNLTIDSAGGTTTVSDNLTVSGTGTFSTPLANSNLANSAVTVTAGDGLTGGGSISLGGSATLNVQVDDSSIETNSDTLRVKASGVTNTMLAGSIANGKLANSTVSYGGISLSLGGTDATPAFNLADATGLPISTGVSGLASNVATFLGTPSSANLRSALTDETGTGNAVFSASPTLTGTVVAANLDISGDVDIDGTTNLDAVDIDGAVDMASSLTLAGNADFNGNLDVDGTSNLDAVDIDGAVDMASSLTLAGNADFNGDLDVDGTTNLDVVDIDGAVDMASSLTIAGALDANGGASLDNVQVGVTNDNEIDTSTGNLVIDSAGGTTTIDDNLTVSGNLTVNGTTTTINSTTVAIDDKNFQVATGAADDAAADGAGLTVDSGDGDKTFNFEATGDNWGASENLNLASGKAYKINNASILNATTLGSSVVASSLTSVGTIATGVWNGTAITNANLANSSVSYGGISLSLGGTDATPAFDLSDATNYPTSSLSGTITNTQLAGSIAASKLAGSIGNSKLSNSTVSYGGISLSLGGTDATPAFDLSDATNYPTSSLTGTITNAQLAGSIEGTKLENSGVSANQYGSSTAIPIITVDAQGLVTAATTTAVDSTTIENGSASVAVASNGPITSTGNHDFTAGIDVTGNITTTGDLTITSTSPTIIFTDSNGAPDYKMICEGGGLDFAESDGTSRFKINSDGHVDVVGNLDVGAGIDITGNITVSGTVDGRDVASDGSKLDGIESSATADQTAAEIRALVESASDSNVFTDSDHSKLNAIEASATADQTASEILTLIKTVDGSGSGLDADTLDGISSASFMRSDTSDTFSGTMTVSGNILPNANGTRDLGANGTRWANVYSSDLDLSNQAKGSNSVDGTWGSYLIEEGEDHLFLTNRRNGKKYRFMVEEV